MFGKNHVRGGIGAGLVFAFYLFTGLDADNDHIFRLQFIIFNAAWLDDHQLAFAVNSADITPGEDHQVVLRQKHVRFIDLLF